MDNSDNPFDTIVIGAGQAGLAAAYHLQKQGLNYLVLEDSKQTAGSWLKYYDSLALFSSARYSSLPGRDFPGEPNRYPIKEEVISYLQEYTDHFKINVRTNERVTEISKNEGVFEIKTVKGNVYLAQTVIAATGAFANPYQPEVAGSELFNGKIIHSSQYKNASDFKDQRIVVVGGANSAVQIAFELAQTSNVSIATRNPITFTPQLFLGRDIHFWLTVSGLDRLPFLKGLSRHTSVLDTGLYKQAILKQKPDSRSLFTSFTEEGVIWPDQKEEKVDIVIFATGFRPNVNYLKPMYTALDDSGHPLQTKGISKSIKGLCYVGLSGQRSFSSATIRGVGADAKYVVKHINRLLKK
jgi:putative flavoprotein involved in K+ transport